MDIGSDVFFLFVFFHRMKIREDGTFTDDIEKFRIMHQKRCKLVEDVDQNFKYYIANTYMTNVPLLCLLLYIIVYPDDDDIVFRFGLKYRSDSSDQQGGSKWVQDIGQKAVKS